MVSPLGWLDGLTATGIVVSNVIFGFLSIGKGKKVGAKLLTVGGLVSIFFGCFWLGPCIDFFLVYFTQTNITPIFLYSILSYMWMAPAVICSMYLGAELLAPRKKTLILVIYTIIGIILEYFILFQNAESFIPPSDYTPGEDVIDVSFNRGHLSFFIIVFLLVSVAIFLVMGSLIKAKKSMGEIRKKFIYITIAFTIFLIVGIADSLFPIGPLIGVFRIMMMSFALWLYLGLKT